MPPFEPHGDFRLERDGYIIKNFASGSANAEALQAFTRQMETLVSEIEGRPFATYAEYAVDVLLTPEAEQLLRAHIADRVARGQVAVALNLAQVENRLIIQLQIGRICDDLGLPWRVFSSYEDARSWLQHRISLASGAETEAAGPSGRYSPHGDYRMEADGRIIVVTAAGATNREAILRYSRDIAEIVDGFDGKPFAIYSIYDNDVLLTQEAEQKLLESIAGRSRLGMCAAAINVSNSPHPEFVAGLIGNLYERARVPWKVFEHYGAAKSWLQDRIGKAEQNRSGGAGGGSDS